MIWYTNSQAPVDTIVSIPDSGNYIFTYLDIPNTGDVEIMIVSDFVVTIINDTRDILDVWAQIGVSNPSEVDYPLRPYVGVLHSNSRARLLPAESTILSVIRLDVINPKLLPTPIPWSMARGPNGRFPQLAPQIFAKGGTKVTNCAVRCVRIG